VASVELEIAAPAARLRAVHLEMVNALVGAEGLARVARITADAIGGPVAIVAPRLRAACVSPTPIDIGELERYVNDRVAGRATRPPRLVAAEEPIAAGEALLGIVALLRNDRPVRSDAAEYLHLAAVSSLTEVAVMEAREEVAQKLRGSFLDDLRTSSQLDGLEVTRRAARLGCDLTDGAVVLCATLRTDRPAHAIATIRSDWPGALAGHDGIPAGGRVYALLPAGRADDDARRATIAAARRLAGRLQHYARVGLSSFYADPADLHGAIHEAELALDVLQISDEPIVQDIGSGTYRLLFRLLASHPEEIRAFYEDTVAPIVRYDAQHRTELLATLETYLATNCNMNAAAAAANVHRHTVASKLERIRAMTDLDPFVSEDRERLGLGIKAHRIIRPRLPQETWGGLDSQPRLPAKPEGNPACPPRDSHATTITTARAGVKRRRPATSSAT
jgi:sugar diacid utilization regulator